MRWRNLELSKVYPKGLREMCLSLLRFGKIEFSALRGTERPKRYTCSVIRETENFIFTHLTIKLPTTHE